MSGFECDPDALRAAAAVLGDVGDRAREVRADGSGGDVAAFGVLGRVTGAAARYEALAFAVDDHLAAAAEFCERAGGVLRQVADEYEVADQLSAGAFRVAAVSGDAPGGGQAAAAGGVPDGGGVLDGGRALDGGDLLLRAPGVGQLAGAVVAVRGGAVGEAVQQCVEFGQGVYECAFGDPVEVLCAAGLSWLLGAVQPLEDELGKVTGNADRLGREADRWRAIAGELSALSQVVGELPEQSLAGWRGAAAGAARRRLVEFAAGLDGIAGEIHDLRHVLIASAGMFEVARGLVVEVLANLVEWAVLTWVTAQATAAASFGASVTMAIAQLDTEAALATERAARVTARVESVLLRIDRAMVELASRVSAHLPAAAVAITERSGTELAGRLPGLAVSAVGQEAAALLDSSVAGLEGCRHLPQPALLPAQLDPNTALIRVG